MYAIQHNNHDLFRILTAKLDHKVMKPTADGRGTTSSGRTVVHQAAESGFYLILYFLCEMGIDVDFQD